MVLGTLNSSFASCISYVSHLIADALRARTLQIEFRTRRHGVVTLQCTSLQVRANQMANRQQQ
jgi:hypothetical protein